MSNEFWTGGSGRLSTGPHLDARVWDVEAKRYVDPNPFLSILEANGKPLVSQFKMTSPFGPRQHPVTGRQGFHSGVDFGTPSGTLVRVRGGRRVDYYDDEPGGGHTVHFAFRDPKGRSMEMRLLHGDKRNALVRAAAAAGMGAPPPPALPPPASDSTLATVAEPVKERALVEQPEDWRRDPTGAQGLAIWAKANPALAAAYQQREGLQPGSLPSVRMELVPEDRGALNGVRIGGPAGVRR